MRVRSLATVLLSLGASFPSPAVSQQFNGRINITTYTLDMDAIAALVGNDFAAIMEIGVDQIANIPGAEMETYTALVRGTVVHTALDGGEMTVDYGSNTFTMYDGTSDTYATWTGEELREMISEMMGQAGGGDMESAMARMRSAMGVEDSETQGPYPVDREDTCGDWWGAHMGDVASQNPMQPGWMIQACLSSDYPEALESMMAMKEAAEQFDMMDFNDAEDAAETEIASHGLPVVFKRLRKGGPMNPTLTFSVTTNEIEPGAISAEDVAPHGTQVTLQQFMQQMMVSRTQ